MKTNKEYRTAGEIRAAAPKAEGELRFDGYAAVFGSPAHLWDDWNEEIEQGAFAEAIQNDDVRALFNHDMNYVLARNKAGTLQLEEDAHGLHFDLVAPDTSWARDLYESVKRGDISQCSFAFAVQNEEWDEEHKIRKIKKCRLFDVSIVTYPAYEDTDAHARSAEKLLEEHRAQEQKQHQRTPLSVYKRKLDLIERS